MKCENCGKELWKGLPFCPHCGKPIDNYKSLRRNLVKILFIVLTVGIIIAVVLYGIVIPYVDSSLTHPRMSGQCAIQERKHTQVNL